MARHERQTRARWARRFTHRAEPPARGIDPEWADDLDELAELAADYRDNPPPPVLLVGPFPALAPWVGFPCNWEDS